MKPMVDRRTARVPIVPVMSMVISMLWRLIPGPSMMWRVVGGLNHRKVNMWVDSLVNIHGTYTSRIEIRTKIKNILSAPHRLRCLKVARVRCHGTQQAYDGNADLFV